MSPAAGLIALAALLTAAPAAGQSTRSAPSSPPEHRLSPDQIEAVLAEAARKREAAEQQLDPAAAGPAPGRPIHGEVGVGIGSAGYRELFGTGIYPLGDEGAAAISLDFVDWGRRRDRR
jgi:hypothetical protein